MTRRVFAAAGLRGREFGPVRAGSGFCGALRQGPASGPCCHLVNARNLFCGYATKACLMASDIASQMGPFAPFAFCKTRYVG